MDFETRSIEIIGGKSSNDSDGLCKASIKKTYDREKAEHVCRVAIDYLMKHNAKMGDLEIIDKGDRVEIRQKTKTD